VGFKVRKREKGEKKKSRPTPWFSLSNSGEKKKGRGKNRRRKGGFTHGATTTTMGKGQSGAGQLNHGIAKERKNQKQKVGPRLGGQKKKVRGAVSQRGRTQKFGPFRPYGENKRKKGKEPRYQRVDAVQWARERSDGIEKEGGRMHKGGVLGFQGGKRGKKKRKIAFDKYSEESGL